MPMRNGTSKSSAIGKRRTEDDEAGAIGGYGLLNRTWLQYNEKWGNTVVFPHFLQYNANAEVISVFLNFEICCWSDKRGN